MGLDDLPGKLARHGLALRGAFAPAPEDGVPPLPGGRPTRAVVMVGSIGGAFWRHVMGSPEAAGPDPIDRWTRRVVDAIAGAIGAVPLYPFDGPPWHPFQRWARRADPALAASPLGILIHPRFGLWHALRAALRLAAPVTAPRSEPMPSPCDGCSDRPCLRGCPVGAFSAMGFDAGACAGHLGSSAGGTCHGLGCRARLACPIAPGLRYPADLQAHLLAAFVAARRRREGGPPTS